MGVLSSTQELSLSIRHRKYLRQKLRTCSNLACKNKLDLDSALRFGRLRPSIHVVFYADKLLKILESLLIFLSTYSEGKIDGSLCPHSSGGIRCLILAAFL